MGNIVNAPLGAGNGSEQIREAFETRLLPALYDFNPDLVIISAGFDAHIRDPLGDLTCTEAGFFLDDRQADGCCRKML